MKTLIVLALLAIGTTTEVDNSGSWDEALDVISESIESTSNLRPLERKALIAATVRDALERVPMDTPGQPESLAASTVLLTAHRLTEDDSYLEAALRLYRGNPDLMRNDAAAASLYEGLVRAARYDEARAFHAEISPRGTNPLPKIELVSGSQTNAPSVWVVENAGMIREANLDVTNYRVLVVAHPGCRFSRRAALDIMARPPLATALGKASLWLTPPGTETEAAAIADWNTRNPQLALHILTSVNGWPELDLLAFPVFHIIEGGETVEIIHGWPDASRGDLLLDYLGAQFQAD